MKFAVPWWLFGTGVALVVAALLVFGGVKLIRDVRRFGDQALVETLITGRAGGRRALKGVLLVLAVAFGFLALAQPQYGRGTRLIPATNLDVVIVLDYSKSMFARDVTPFRIARAKSEVAHLIEQLPGARFGAVAFAGQPMKFPLTSDGSAIAQFFRQLGPNDMPVGGTAIARALEAARELFASDPISKNHRKVMLLVTDGEDLQGDPLSVAEAVSKDGITIHVVQIGGRTPEPLPEVNEAGEVVGWRTDESGAPITTSLTAEGEQQLSQIAEKTGGRIARSQHGETGIREITKSLKQMMTEELSEKVETVYADVYFYPLSLAILLLLAEVLVPETKRRARAVMVPPPKQSLRRRRRSLGRAASASVVLVLALASFGCEQALDDLFTRHSPLVDEAVVALDAGDAQAAVDLLQNYLSTGKCEEGEIGTPASVVEHENASLDLGLGLFLLGEQYGKRFGEDAPTAEGEVDPDQQAKQALRSAQVDCALRIVRLCASDPELPIDLRARAHYLGGNLEFLRGEYRSAVNFYDLALRLIPGMPADAGDGIGRDVAWNRAIALARLEEQERQQDAGADAAPDAPPEAGDEAGPPDAGQDASQDQDPDAGQQDQQPDAGTDDGGSDGGGNQEQQDKPPPEQPDAGPRPEPKDEPTSASQDDQILDMLERAPTLQQEAERRRGGTQRALGMEDK